MGKKIVAVVFTAFILLELVFTSIGTVNDIYGMAVPQNSKTDKLKPAAEGAGDYEEEENSAPKTATLYDNIIRTLKGFESRINSYVYPNPFFIETFGATQVLLNKRIIHDSRSGLVVVKLDDNSLSFFHSEPIEIERKVKGVDKLHQFVEKRQTKLLYVQAPFCFSEF